MTELRVFELITIARPVEQLLESLHEPRPPLFVCGLTGEHPDYFAVLAEYRSSCSSREVGTCKRRISNMTRTSTFRPTAPHPCMRDEDPLSLSHSVLLLSVLKSLAHPRRSCWLPFPPSTSPIAAARRWSDAVACLASSSRSPFSEAYRAWSLVKPPKRAVPSRRHGST